MIVFDLEHYPSNFVTLIVPLYTTIFRQKCGSIFVTIGAKDKIFSPDCNEKPAV